MSSRLCLIIRFYLFFLAIAGTAVDLHHFSEEEVMEIPIWVYAFHQGFIEEAFTFHGVGIEYFTFYNEFGLLEAGSVHYVAGDGHQAAFLDFIDVFAGFGTAVIQVFMKLRREGAEGETIVFLQKAQGVALRAYAGYRHRLVPERPEKSPGNGHGVEIAGLEIACREQHPVFIQVVEYIGVKILNLYMASVRHFFWILLCCVL